MAKTVVALYDDRSEAEAAIRELQDNGFRREDISLAASDTSRREGMDEGTGDTGNVAAGAIGGAGVGAVLGGIAGLVVGLGALAIPGIGPIVAAGPLAAALGGAGMGAVAGGLVGALVGLGIPQEEAEAYAEGVRRGSTLLTVRADDSMADLAANVMNRHNPVNVRQRTTEWRQGGWHGFDPNAGEYRRETTGGTYAERTYRSETTGTSDYDRERARYDEPATSDRDLVTGMGGTDPGRRDYERTDYGRGTYEARDFGGYPEAPGFDMYENDFRRHYDRTFGTSGYPYDRYRPAYMYGYDLHRTRDCNGDCRWEDVEMNARRDWEQTHPGNAWEDFKEAIREGWNALTGR
jgi:hypothetical protein